MGSHARVASNPLNHTTLSAAGVLAMATVACTQPRPPVDAAALARVERWWIVIGSSPMLESLDWRHYARDAQMVVLSGDPRIPIGDLPKSAPSASPTSASARPIRAGRYWPEVRGQPFLVEPNPDWPDNLRVDIRDPRWQEVLLCEEIAGLMQRGFDGLMLDTIDTVPYLENEGPGAVRGIAAGAARLVAATARGVPAAVLVANGSDALVDAAPFVDGSSSRACSRSTTSAANVPARRPTPSVTGSWRAIARARAVAPRPVFTIEYADVGDVGALTVGLPGIAPSRISSLRRRPRPQHRALIRAVLSGDIACIFQLFLNI